MIGRRSVIGLALLCALVVGVVGAANASAAGTTAFTCVSAGGSGEFKDSHCDEKVTTNPGFKHVAIAEGESTTLGVAATESSTLKGVIAGVNVKIVCTGVSALSGTAKNETVSGVMQNVGSNIVLDYTGCSVAEPSGQGCVVNSSTIKTNALTSTTVEGTTATTTGVKFSPPSSGIFTNIVIEGCSNTVLNGSFPVKGTAVGAPKGTTPSGATLKFTAASTAGLTFAGHTATLEGTVTVSGRKTGTEEAFKPLSLTTTTP